MSFICFEKVGGFRINLNIFFCVVIGNQLKVGRIILVLKCCIMYSDNEICK